MKVLFTLCFGLFLASNGWAEFRAWSAANGSSTIDAELVSCDGIEVVLKKRNNQQITVPLTKLCAADQNYLAEKVVCQERPPSKRPPAPTNLPCKMGQIVGPIEASAASHYLLYLPTTLCEGRKAPLLFYTHSGGGNQKLFEVLTEGSELNGWVLAMSMESRNKNDVDDNKRASKEAVEHILKTLPVNEDRLYFVGNSGGAAMAFYNYDNLGGYGLMPNVGYIPGGINPPNGDTFIINGAFDFNRYTSASARKKIGKTAIHRFHKGGHGKPPAWLMIDGMLWLEGRHLGREGDHEPDVRNEYVESVLNWLEQCKSNEPYRAYYWALFLKNELKLSMDQSNRVESNIKELRADPNNQLYVDGLEALDQFSVKKLSTYGEGALMNHTDGGVTSGCRKLLKTYDGVPVIGETLHAMMKETGALKGD